MTLTQEKFDAVVSPIITRPGPSTDEDKAMADLIMANKPVLEQFQTAATTAMLKSVLGESPMVSLLSCMVSAFAFGIYAGKALAEVESLDRMTAEQTE